MTSTYKRIARAASTPLRWFIVGVIRVYQRTLSPFLGRHCRFQPTCSEYFIEAIEKRGLVVGMALGLWRILRCNPFCRAGYDPVPDAPEQAPRP